MTQIKKRRKLRNKSGKRELRLLEARLSARHFLPSLALLVHGAARGVHDHGCADAGQPAPGFNPIPQPPRFSTILARP